MVQVKREGEHFSIYDLTLDELVTLDHIVYVGGHQTSSEIKSADDDSQEFVNPKVVLKTIERLRTSITELMATRTKTQKDKKFFRDGIV